ncbi:M23 family metallopeptidase [Anaerospora hongkongensis]|uniref:M23 family metallopeptidase n=1 Tax=Anaerospora hongkongensis TaxID=244830 RepID=UPI00289A96A8|nr:M23 family metallopeptidase [Anaerospora hongkongensis]
MVTPNEQQTNTSQARAGNEQIARAIAMGLIATGVEGGYDAVSRSSKGDYPSIGCSQWEGGRADTLLFAIPGGEQFVGRSYSSLSSSDIQQLKQLLDSEKGQAAQQAQLSQDCLEDYIPTLAGVEKLSKAKSYVYAGIWCPTSHNVVSAFLRNRQDQYDINDLETLRDMFRDQYYIAADVGEQYKDGYANRAIATYNYVAGLDDAISSAAIDKSVANSVFSTAPGTAKSSDSGFSVSMKTHGKHADSTITKLPKGKTFCEPVYPDLVTVSDKVPQWLLDQVKIPVEKCVDTGMLVYQIPTNVLKDALGQDLDSVLGSAASSKERQKAFNAKAHQREFKHPNPGKPANNNEPFPVDLKIEELETHKPTVKIHTITTCPEAVNAAKAVLKVSDTAEKRIVKLENMMATMLRYLMRIGSRMNINCVYYGGQTPFEKYNCIRCLKDDRLTDGQMISIDQCLNCTRYEPIIGQVYEIMNDLGANLASVLDDNQMAYMSMQDYIDFTRVENYHKERDKATLNTATVTVRDPAEKEFKDQWPEGVKMKWELVPVEEQKPHINWRQSIQDDGNKMNKLSSFPQDEKNAGTNITGGKSVNVNIMKKNADAMNNDANAVLAPLITLGKNGSGVSDELINKLKGGLQKDIQAKVKASPNTDIDPLIIAAIMHAENASDPGQVIQRYSEVMTELQIKNPAIVISAYKAQASTFMGQEKPVKLPRIDMVVKPDPNGSTSGSSSSTTPSASGGFGLNWESRESWLWPQFAEPMTINLTAMGSNTQDITAFFPRVCYIYVELCKVVQTSRFDGEQFAFPFFEDQLNRVWYVSPFGWRDSTQSRHCGIDLAVGPENAGLEIHAVQDGVVINVAGDAYGTWNGIVIQHEGGWYSRYFHNRDTFVSEGAVVHKGDVIAAVGDTGSPGAFHLHVEICQGGSGSDNAQDPLIHWPLLNGHLQDGGSPLADQ